MKPEISYRLYLVTDRDLMSSPTLEEGVEQAVQGGVTLVQLREKDCSSLEFYQTAQKVKAICDAHKVPLIINDRVDIALAVDAAGVHIGQSDLPASVVRKILGPDKILGVSAGTVAQAVQAQQDGADYLGVGAMFPTGTKEDADITSMEELNAITKAVEIPMVIIGGINKGTIPQFTHCDIDGVAVVSAILTQPDIRQAAQELDAMLPEGWGR